MFGRPENFLADGQRETYGGVGQKFGAELWGRTGNTRQSNVDAIGRGAGHQAENQEGLHNSQAKSFKGQGLNRYRVAAPITMVRLDSRTKPEFFEWAPACTIGIPRGTPPTPSGMPRRIMRFAF